jgi:hypothetical protein
MDNLLYFIIDTYFGAWTNSEWFGRVVGYTLIIFTILVFGLNVLSMCAGTSLTLWRVFFASLFLTAAFLYFVKPPV